MAATATCVYVAGIDGSPPEHWQSRWRGRDASGVWVEHDNWERPVCDVWVQDLNAEVSAIEGPVVLVAHSLGCSVVIEWAHRNPGWKVTGAFLVAVPDVHGARFPTAAVGFDTPPRRPLPFRSVVVASEDDPYGSMECSAAIATCLGAELVNVGPKGHLNADSGLADWPEGWFLLADRFEL